MEESFLGNKFFVMFILKGKLTLLHSYKGKPWFLVNFWSKLFFIAYQFLSNMYLPLLSMIFCHFWGKWFSAALWMVNVLPSREFCRYRNKLKSDGVRSRLYDSYFKSSKPSAVNFYQVMKYVCGLALSWYNTFPVGQFWSLFLDCFAQTGQLVIDNSLPVPLNTNHNLFGRQSRLRHHLWSTSVCLWWNVFLVVAGH